MVTSWPHGWLYRLLHRLDPTPWGRPAEEPDCVQADWLVACAAGTCSSPGTHGKMVQWLPPDVLPYQHEQIEDAD